MKVQRLIYNWYQTGSVVDRDGAGDNYLSITVGRGGVKDITEHIPQGEGDRFNYLIEYEDGHFMRVFNPNTVEYFKGEIVS